MNEKLNNYHFGRHVFEYFPWYTYPSDLQTIPTLDNDIRIRFNFAFKNSTPIFIWEGVDESYLALIGESLEDFRYLRCSNGELRYRDFLEDVNDWEDVEKIRLRLILGTKKMADEYFKIIELHNNYIDRISDMVYLQVGEDIKIPICNISDSIDREYKNICLNFITNEDVYESMQSNTFKHNKFTDSVQSYYRKKEFYQRNKLTQ